MCCQIGDATLGLDNWLDLGLTNCLTLKTGLQQRIVLTLTHNSGRQFPWTRVTKMEIGQVRLLDRKGRLSESPQDGTSVIVAQASWDSTLHDSIFLNKTTHSSSRVLLELTWYVEAKKCIDLITFSMDVAVQVQGQLWRLNTASKYVRGKELLGDWKPRGVSLVKDYKKISESIREKEIVDCIKQIIALKGNKECEKHKNPEKLYKKILTLWRKNEEQRRSNTITKKGYLFTPENANDDHWVMKWYVLRRPYLFIYESLKETEEQGAINLASVRVDYKRDLEDML
ncbi:kinesin protein [Gigaspora rosea]|uniref:Kinesin protein n=1 Tax=Gigaspora rosea TaxID=44941 RepID=A0A397VKZ8_9GLOM|nr:kinesin protein [Gigaspora rosea]